MKKYYEAKIRLEGTILQEDPRCPSRWKGSGCYDINVACSQAAEVSVAAESEEEARRAIEEFDYGSFRDCEVTYIEDVIILKITCNGEDEAEENGVVDVAFSPSSSVEEDGPEPEDRYEEHLIRKYEENL